ncbi:endonuclease/exonuclease/phosphatase family protein [Aestuariibius insulae]|uniref:endonuclease/exonuclease/phosphatase family protein n=1 Tax=Aestuariibius insulae TaxID=2058287 RepID=UPI00345E7441
MTLATVASFNVKNLIGPDKEYYRFESYTPEEYAWKQDWLADQLLTMDADVVGFQEIFEEDTLRAVVAETNRRGALANAANVPDPSKRYAKKAIFRKLAFQGYDKAELVFAPNANDGEPGQRRPGLAILSRFGFAEPPEVLQVLDPPVEIGFRDLDGEPSGSYRLSRLSRPVLKARIPIGNQIVTVFNCHLKSKLGEYDRPPGAPFAPAVDLTRYNPAARALGSLRAGLRRMAEAWMLRRAVLTSLGRSEPVIVLGDFNDGEAAVSSEIIAGETPFKNYAWMRRHDAERRNDRYSDEENEQITEDIEAVRLHSAEKLFVRKSLRDMVYTAAFGGEFESIDQIYLSRHFHPDYENRIGEMEYFSVLNDHLTDGSHPEAPYNKLASDHGQIMAHLRFNAS